MGRHGCFNRPPGEQCRRNADAMWQTGSPTHTSLHELASVTGGHSPPEPIISLNPSSRPTHSRSLWVPSCSRRKFYFQSIMRPCRNPRGGGEPRMTRGFTAILTAGRPGGRNTSSPSDWDLSTHLELYRSTLPLQFQFCWAENHPHWGRCLDSNAEGSRHSLGHIPGTHSIDYRATGLFGLKPYALD